MSCTGVTSMGSNATANHQRLPFGPRPSISSEIAFELGAVARITRAPLNASRSLLRSSRPPSPWTATRSRRTQRSEEHTSELQSRQYLVCRLLLEKKKKKKKQRQLNNKHRLQSYKTIIHNNQP